MPKTTLTPRERAQEIKRLRLVLKTGRFTCREMASIRGKIGGLSGYNHPGRRKGGYAAAKKRWGFVPSKAKLSKPKP